jgi:hypothetical protein
MANEIYVDYGSGSTLYAAIRNAAGQVWNAAGRVFENWGTGGHAAGDYAITLIDRGGSRYVADFDTNAPAGTYFIQTFLQAGAGPADTDTLLGNRQIVWTGVGELTVMKATMNKAVWDRLTGAIDYYDDDGQTILLTHTRCQTQASITRDIEGP